MAVFDGFDGFDWAHVKPILKDRLAIFRASQCDLADFAVQNFGAQGKYVTGALIARILGKPGVSVSQQASLIQGYLGRFNHKKAPNVVALVAYLYSNLLETL